MHDDFVYVGETSMYIQQCYLPCIRTYIGENYHSDYSKGSYRLVMKSRVPDCIGVVLCNVPPHSVAKCSLSISCSRVRM